MTKKYSRPEYSLCYNLLCLDIMVKFRGVSEDKLVPGSVTLKEKALAYVIFKLSKGSYRKAKKFVIYLADKGTLKFYIEGFGRIK